MHILEYNNLDMVSTPWAVRMNEAWKQWEGQTVDGEFALRQYLGGSDCSAVFLTEFGEQKGQRAAVKLTVANREDAELRLSRCGTAATPSHPHLIHLFQAGRCRLENTDLLYVVMEYAEEDLSQVLPHRPLTPTETVDTLSPVLDALAFLHAKGLVHGHLRPTNIMAVDNQVKISSDRLLKVGESIFSVGKSSPYDAPETASGGVSPASDVWSLGMTLVESLTQHLPLWKTRQQEPVLPKTLPQPFLEIASHCLRRDPQSRWTVADIQARLRSTSSVSQEQSIAKVLRPSTKRRYLVLTAVGFVLLAILAGPRLLKPRPKPLPELSRVTAEAPEQPETRATSVGFVDGAVVNQVVPDVPKQARDTIQGTVRVAVRVAVDSSGNVAGAKLDSPGPSRYFANLALQSARAWTFRPAEIDGRKVPSEWILQFQFEKTGSRVVPVQAGH